MRKPVFRAEGSTDWTCKVKCSCGIKHTFWFTGQWRKTGDKYVAKFKSKLCSNSIYVEIDREDLIDMLKAN